AAPSYLDQHPDIKTPADLAQHNCLTYRLNPGRTIWRFKEQGGAIVEAPVTGTFQTDNGQALLSAITAGMGIGLMPDWSIRDELKSGSLRRLFTKHSVTYVEFENGVYAVYQKSRHKSPKVRVFVDFMSGLFKELRA
ncbi:MAG: substrate binding domain-containing protein, partial [Afipia sp.]|nr:substrate binding domain-containing protein [Afipia sp.]